MITTDPRFLLFFVLVFAVHWALRSQRARSTWLLAASYVFYACWDWRLLSLLWISTLVDHVAARRIDGSRSHTRRRAWLAASLTVNLGMLATFKYLGFFVESAVALLARLGVDAHVPTLEIVLPVGISFYTFQTMSYTLDVHAGRLRARRDVLDVALFVAFFPQLVAGPIVRARDFLPQLDVPCRLSQVAARASLSVFAVGFFKKACVADALAPITDAFYASPTSFDVASTWGVLGLYATQLYCDFSGYSDMAIGLAGLLGFGLRENFRFPFLAADVRDFWRRWHMSLGAWAHDYVWRPLCATDDGRAPSEARITRATLITLLAIGVWHGAAWTFVWLGLVHGVALIAHRRWARGRAAGRLPRPLAIAATFTFVAASMVLFRAPDLDTAATVYGHALGLGVPGPLSLGAGPVLAFVGLATFHVIHATGVPRRLAARVPDELFAVGYGATGAVLLAFASGLAEPFIYFQF